MNLLQYPFNSAHILQKKRALKKELAAREGLLEKKIAIVSGSTVGDFKNILELFLLNAGIRPTFWEGEYGLFYEEVVFDDGSLAAFAPDVLYIHTSSRNLRHWPTPAHSAADVQAGQDDEFARFEAVWQAAKKLGCPIVQNNFEAPTFRNFGNMDAWDARGRTHYVNTLNARFAAAAAATPGLYLHDLAYLAAQHGVRAFSDDMAWYGYKYACAPAFIPDWCHSLAGLIKSFFGLSKKGVVADLDNTLWGGVIGEEGPDGIEVGEESPAGMAYAAFQGYLKMLAQRGILLAAASKNDAAIAEEGLARTDNLLHRDDFLAFEVHWEPKSQSVARIAQSLNIGADSLVFVDDNPAEREEVHRALPGVETPPVAAPEDSIPLLDGGGWFEVSALSADDLARGAMYRENARRQALEAIATDYTGYLQSLQMQADIGPVTPGTLERVTQLVNKTNQFNPTTRRYTAAEVEALMHDPACITLAGRLADKFGDNGLTSVIFGRITGAVLDIELWVMSCRVLKRQFEQAMFDTLVAEAKKRGVATINGTWRPTAKNLMVRDLYATIGFSLTAETPEARHFTYPIPAGYTPQNTVIEVNTPHG
ncbi:MAG: HAD-IIIC family phosphatase [Ruminococcaceae bacterium]|nr:HAD-IIIC family phosphatase [Oscillospiraceae bacterium]